MKTFKRFSAILIAVFLMISMMVIPASATEPTTYTITINGTGSNHTYEAYQIFTGSLHDKTLSNIQWGEDIDGTKLLNALKNDETFSTDTINWFATCTDAMSLAEMLQLKVTTTILTDKFASHVFNSLNADAVANESTVSDTSDTTYTIKDLAPGYYLIKDKAVTGLENDSFTKYMISVVKDVELTPKSAKPSVTKTVGHSATDANHEGISASFGSIVYFKLTGTLPTDIGQYPSYSYKLEDTLPTGFSFEDIISVKFINTNEGGKIVDITGNKRKDDGTAYFSYDDNGQTRTIDFGDIKSDILDASGSAAIASDTVEIIFSAKIDLATVSNGAATSANIGDDGNVNTVKLIYSAEPNVGATGATSFTTDTATVFVSQLVVNKKDENGNSLKGAEFILYRSLGDGSYIYVVATKVNDGVYYITNTKISNSENDETAGTHMAVSQSGTLTIYGIGAGNIYRLWETKSPDGFNEIGEPVIIPTTVDIQDGVLKGVDANGVTPTTVASEGTHDTAAAAIVINVVNTAGSTLPETGGIGTTIFYGIGGVLVIGALSLLIVRKRTTAK